MYWLHHYEKLIEKAVQRGSKREKGKNQDHHILPRCLGGSDAKENKVFLYHREHLIAHLLLVKIHPDEAKLVYAAFRMSNKNGSRKYAWLKENYSKIISESNRNRIVSQETRDKQSKTAKERKNWINPFAGEKGSEMSSRMNKKRAIDGTNPWAGERGSKNSKNICAEQLKNGTHPFQGEQGSTLARERNLKQMANGTHVTQMSYICPYCEKTGTGRTMFRWHFSKCKQNFGI